MKRYKYFNKTFRDGGYIHLLISAMVTYTALAHNNIPLLALAGYALGAGVWILIIYNITTIDL